MLSTFKKVLLELYQKISSKHIEVRSCFDLPVGGNATVRCNRILILMLGYKITVFLNLRLILHASTLFFYPYPVLVMHVPI
jgi:hypothetical protein